VGDLVAQTAAGLAHLGVGAGRPVLLMLRNRPEFHWLDLAAQFLRAVPISIYNSSSPEEIAYLAEHCGAEVAILEDRFLDRLAPVRRRLPDLRHVLALDDADGGPAGLAVRPYQELLDHGSADLEALAERTRPDDLATVIYTSGTTGPAKGVMISQHNVAYTVEQLRRCLGWDTETMSGLRMVSYLPMAHIAERMTSHYQAVTYGLSVTTCPDPAQLPVYAREVHPEILFGVPRVWEKIHAGVNAALAADPEKQARFGEGLDAALVIKAAERAGTATEEQRETWAFLDAVAFSTVRQLVGLDAVRVAITGAAPLTREILEWFNAIGVPLSEIYGMSETSGPMTWDPYDIRPGTVGRAIPGCEVRLADDGEVVCRGGNVFVGYLNDPDKTAEALQDGWLHSGDVGRLDGDGYLTIVDRKKELIITAGGKNISPANLEGALKTIPLVGQAAAIGDERRFVSALLVLDPELAAAWAERNGLGGMPLDDLARHPTVLAEVQRGVDDVNRQFADVEQIKKFVLLGDEWQPDSDVLTPTSKLKRRGVAARYQDLIDGMYAG
jgi:long-chain acyl-CoA synthetase